MVLFRAVERAAQRHRKPLRVVADRVLRKHVDAAIGQLSRDVGTVRIDEVSEQQFRSDGDDLDAGHAGSVARAGRGLLPAERGDA